ncbi:MAG: phage holin family protein [Bacteroidaceae bacterium]|nr:phage holin family protein [Bacteroidaceae bacterium]
MLNFSGKYTEECRLLIEELRRYFLLEKRLLALELTEKTASLIGSLLLVIIGILLGSIALLMLLFALACWISSLTGSMVTGFLVIAAAVVVLLALVFVNSRRWIVNPIIRMVANIFLNNDQHGNK